MRTLNKLIITKWNDRILTVLFSDGQPLEIGLEENSSILGNIYIGKVNRIVKNLNSAFVLKKDGQDITAFLTIPVFSMLTAMREP